MLEGSSGEWLFYFCRWSGGNMFCMVEHKDSRLSTQYAVYFVGSSSYWLFFYISSTLQTLEQIIWLSKTIDMSRKGELFQERWMEKNNTAMIFIYKQSGS